MMYSPGTARAVAYPNIALVKYWGKRDESLMLPVSSSLSVTLDLFPTQTTVRLTGAARDTVIMAGRAAGADTASRVGAMLDLVRKLSGRSEFASVDTANSGPTKAGVASSASGFAALAAAAAAAYGVELTPRELSRLARRGSGSASRSVFGGFVAWHAGHGTGTEGDLSSYAEPLEARLDVAMVVALVDTAPKAIGSGAAMRRTVATSPYFPAWVTSSSQDFDVMRAAIAADDFPAVGEIAESNALRMHATMLAARPPIRYLCRQSMAVLDAIEGLRREGIAVYATADAGPNVKALCRRGDAAEVAATLRRVDGVQDAPIALPGPGVSVTGGVR